MSVKVNVFVFSFVIHFAIEESFIYHKTAVSRYVIGAIVEF